MRVGLIPESVCLEARMSPFVAPRRTAERARSAIGARCDRLKSCSVRASSEAAGCEFCNLPKEARS